MEQSTSAIVIEQHDVSQSKVRIFEQLLHEHDQVHQVHHTEIIINGEIIMDSQVMDQ